MKANITTPNPEPQRLTDGFGLNWDIELPNITFDIDLENITFDVPGDFDLPLNWDIELNK